MTVSAMVLAMNYFLEQGQSSWTEFENAIGDEFGILLFKTDPRAAHAKASTLACRIANEYVEMPTGNVSVTAAWGVAPCESDDTPEQILARADRAMYMAKKSKI